MTTRVLIVGAGAIGGFYGALLARQDAEVSVVCRSDYTQVKQHGIEINSHSLGNWIFKPSQILRNASEFQGTADYVFLCTKIIPGLDRVNLIRDAISPETAIVFIQNGIEIEQELLDAFPDNEVISGLAFICSNRVRPGKIVHLAYGRLALGNASERIEKQKKTLHLCNLFNHSGIECIAADNILTARWQKCVWNAPFSPLSVLSGGLLTSDILHSQEAFVRSIMQEVCSIAAATGHPLPDNIIDINIKSTYDMPPYKTSMLLDFEQGHPMETEAILGNTIRAGRRSGTVCPHLETVYALIKLRELQISSNHLNPAALE